MNERYNPRDPDVVANTFPAFARLRDENPVHHSGILGGWVLTSRRQWVRHGQSLQRHHNQERPHQMKDTFKEGMIRKETILVDKDRTIGFLGEGLRVYATPDLIRDIEHTCLDFIKEYADDNEHSVGTYVEVIHGAGSPLGMSVDITVTVKEIDRRKITFNVVAHDGIDEVCTGTHSRFVVDVNKLKEKVEAKVAKAKALKG